MTTTMSATEDFLSKLNPKIAKEIRKASQVETETLPTASYGLNQALGGGIGKKRVCLLYGNTSAGKSALVMQSIGRWQRDGQVVAYVDVEGTWDNEWAKRLGVDTDEIILIQRRSVSKIYNDTRPLLEAGVDVLVIDSISMALPDAFISTDGHAKDLEDHKQIGAHAKAITALVTALHYSNENTAIILISQTTTEIGQTYTKQVPHGGKKVQFAASQIIKLTSSGTEKNQIKDDIQVGSRLIEMPVGRKVQVVIEKNKIGPPGRTCEYDFYYAGNQVGIDYVGEVVDEAVKFGVIAKGGAWFSHGENKWQGRDSLVKHVRNDAEFMSQLEAEVAEAKNGQV